ncbi:MAG: winged helix-turn-helix domain-containing protein [Burkholderiaceae bacterium]|nr:winged helix-turn-helix domain-containing protein [Burkholderiaceae bacterium]
MALHTLQARPLCELIAQQVRESILRREWTPGQTVSESVLVARYGVSRTPVREALKLLQHEGMLTAHTRRGVRVRELSEAERKEAHVLHQILVQHLRQQPAEGPAGHDSMSRRFLKMLEWRL